MYRIAICDDEAVCIQQIDTLLSEYKKLHEDIELEWDTYASSLELTEAVLKKNYDIYLLDIYIDVNSGIDIAKEIRDRDSHSDIIFLSSSDAFYKEAFRLQAKEYLEKPLMKEDLYRTLDRVCKKEKECYLYLKEGDGARKIPVSEICYVTSEGHYKKVMTSTGAVLVRMTMEEIYNELQQEYFYMPCGKYIINVKKMKRITRTEMVMEDGSSFPIPRGKYRHAGELFAMYSF